MCERKPVSEYPFLIYGLAVFLFILLININYLMIPVEIRFGHCGNMLIHWTPDSAGGNSAAMLIISDTPLTRQGKIRRGKSAKGIPPFRLGLAPSQAPVRVHLPETTRSNLIYFYKKSGDRLRHLITLRTSDQSTLLPLKNEALLPDAVDPIDHSDFKAVAADDQHDGGKRDPGGRRRGRVRDLFVRRKRESLGE